MKQDKSIRMNRTIDNSVDGKINYVKVIFSNSTIYNDRLSKNCWFLCLLLNSTVEADMK